MAYTVLARRYRPQSFDEVIGQDAVVRTLRNAIAADRVAHAYLFTGTRGVGKTTLARLLAKALNCEKGPTPDPCGKCDSCRRTQEGDDLDVIEIDGASNTGVDDVRDLRANTIYAPSRSRFKIYIIDEVHMLSNSAFNALLKTLEEPPEHVKFIFATTDPQKVPATIHSRCQRFDFRSVPTQIIADHLAHVCKKEKIKADQDALHVIAREGRGSVRDALTILDQAITVTGGAVRLEAVLEALGLAGAERYFHILDALQARDAAGGSTGRKRAKLNLGDVPSDADLRELGRHISFTERRADDAESELRRVKILELLEKRLGDEFAGVVTGITNFGNFVQLGDWLVDGLVRYEDLMDDWWDVDERSGIIRGQRTGRRIGIGDVATVRIARVDVARRELDLAILEVRSRCGKIDVEKPKTKKANPREKSQPRGRARRNGRFGAGRR